MTQGDSCGTGNAPLSRLRVIFTRMLLLAIVVVIALQVGADPWSVYGKALVPVTAVMLVLVFALVWFATKKAVAEWNELAKRREASADFRKIWMDLAREREKSGEFRTAAVEIIREEWKTDAFEEAVNRARQTLTNLLIEQTYKEIDRRIAAHNSRDNEEAHRATIVHVVANFPALQDLLRRVEKLEKRGRGGS